PEGLADGRGIEFGVLVLQVAAGIEVGAAEAQGLLVDRAARLGVWNERMVTRSDEELHPGRAVPLRLLYRVVHVGVVNRRGNLLQLNELYIALIRSVAIQHRQPGSVIDRERCNRSAV